ncbi:MAG: hypothetical protein ACYC3O_09800 [Burkholderiales bacterium]
MNNESTRNASKLDYVKHTLSERLSGIFLLPGGTECSTPGHRFENGGRHKNYSGVRS